MTVVYESTIAFNAVSQLVEHCVLAVKMRGKIFTVIVVST